MFLGRIINYRSETYLLRLHFNELQINNFFDYGTFKNRISDDLCRKALMDCIYNSRFDDETDRLLRFLDYQKNMTFRVIPYIDVEIPKNKLEILHAKNLDDIEVENVGFLDIQSTQAEKYEFWRIKKHMTNIPRLNFIKYSRFDNTITDKVIESLNKKLGNKSNCLTYKLCIYSQGKSIQNYAWYLYCREYQEEIEKEFSRLRKIYVKLDDIYNEVTKKYEKITD